MDNVEKWKDVVGFEGYYQVSNLGRVKSMWRAGGIMMTRFHPAGYELVNLSSNTRKGYTARIHRLVADAFIPNIENKREINHIDGNPRNNRLENLEWVTPKENSNHSRNVTMNGRVISLKKVKELMSYLEPNTSAIDLYSLILLNVK